MVHVLILIGFCEGFEFALYGQDIALVSLVSVSRELVMLFRYTLQNAAEVAAREVFLVALLDIELRQARKILDHCLLV